MNWQEYVSLAIRTESIPAIALITDESQTVGWNNTKTIRLLHAALGVCTEVAELYDGHTVVNKLEELGDILWYLAIADDVLDWHSEHYHADMTKPPVFYIGDLQDVVKRHIFYGKELDVERISRSFSAIMEHVVVDLEVSGLPLEDCYRANIMKLEKRYPEKFFDAKAAIHRDVDRELEHIGADGKILQARKHLDKVWELWKELTSENGVSITNSWTCMPDPVGLKQVVLDLLGITNSEAIEIFGAAITHAQVLVVKEPDPYQFRIRIIPYTAEEIQALAETADPVPEEGLSPETIMETFFPVNQVQLSYDGWNDIVKAMLTPGQVEKLAMDLAFTRAKYYRMVGALSIARGYDAMYAAFSGRGDKLEDHSLVMMWQESGYPMDPTGLKERLERWK